MSQNIVDTCLTTSWTVWPDPQNLLELEVEATRARRQRGRLRFARYPVLKTLADFDFDFQPSLDRQAS